MICGRKAEHIDNLQLLDRVGYEKLLVRNL